MSSFNMLEECDICKCSKCTYRKKCLPCYKCTGAKETIDDVNANFRSLFMPCDKKELFKSE